MRKILAFLLLVLAATAPALTQSDDAASWAVEAGLAYRVVPNQTYLTANGYESKLDVIVPRSEGPHPTLLHTVPGSGHGGFSLPESLEAHAVIREFLARHVGNRD